MKRFTVLLLLFLALPAWAGNTYYVSPTGSNTSPYETWTKAANQLSTIFALNPVGGPHTVYVAPGTYSAASIANAAWNSASIIGTAAHGSTAAAAKGQVILSGGATTLAIETATGVNVSNVSITAGTSQNLYLASANQTYTNCYSYGAPATNLRATSAATGMTLTNCLFESTAGSAALTMAGSATFNCCTLRNSATANMGLAVGLDNTGTLLITVNNSILMGGTGAALRNSGAGTTTVNNSVLMGGEGNSATVIRTNGTVNLNNNVILPGVATHPDALSGTIATDSGNVKTAGPKWTAHRMGGFLIPAVDDVGNLVYAQSLETELAGRGLKGSYYVQAKDVVANDAALETMLGNGTMEIGVHSYSHSNLSGTGTAWTVTKADHTIDVDRAGDQIVVAGAAPVTVSGFKAKTLATIRAELLAGGCSNSALSNILETSLGEALADSEGAQACSAPGYAIQLLIDSSGDTGYFYVEGTYAKSLMEATLTGYTANTFSCPSGGTSLDLRTALKTKGYLGARAGQLIDRANWSLASLNVYWLTTFDFTTAVKGANDAATTANAYGLCEWIAERGAIVVLLAHSTTEATIAQWQIVLNAAAQYSDITVTSLEGALTTIRALPWTTADNITWTRTFTDSSDYHLLAGSPCINTGLDLGDGSLYLDPDGENPDSYGSGWEIGLYQYPVASIVPKTWWHRRH